MKIVNNTLHSELKNLIDKWQVHPAMPSRDWELFLSDLNTLYSKKDEELHKLRPVIDIIPNTISWIKKDLTYISVNQALADFCGLMPQDFIGKEIGFHCNDKMIYDFSYELFHGSHMNLVRTIESNFLNGNKTFLLIGSKIDETAIITGIDITELENLRNHVHFNEKLTTLGELFAGIIHDMSNPLTLIEGNTKRLKKIMQDNSLALQYLDKIEMSAEKMIKLTKSVRVFARNENGFCEYEENLGKLLEEAKTILEHRLNHVKVEVDPKLSNYIILGNPTEVFRVFVNLIGNAIDAIEEGDFKEKWIRISTGIDHEQLHLFFTDSGPGIPSNMAKKIFEPFYTTKSAGKGTGIGLSLSQKIIRDHKGEISLDQNSRNTCFKVSFPRFKIKEERKVA